MNSSQHDTCILMKICKIKCLHYIICEMKSCKQNRWVKTFSCTLVVIELQVQKTISTCFVFDFNFVTNLKFTLNHLT
jgi:hypothetical protein